jgi:hypothetical protein
MACLNRNFVRLRKGNAKFMGAANANRVSGKTQVGKKQSYRDCVNHSEDKIVVSGSSGTSKPKR